MGKFLTVSVDLDSLKSFQGPLFTPQEEQEVLDEVGTLLLSEVRQNFEELSRRGTGVDGTKWKELETETEIKKAMKGNWKPRNKKGEKKVPPRSQIGVDTGLLRNSSVPGQAGNVFEFGKHSVTIGFGREYAKYFHAIRPLIPNEMPSAWNKQCAAIISDFILEKLTGRRGTG